MAEEWDYGNDWGATYDPWYPEVTNAGGVADYFQNPAYQSFTGWGDPTGPGSSGDTSGGNWWNTVLGGLGQVGSFLGQNAGVIGPLAGAAGSLAGGAIGSNAAQDASRLQADALNRGIDLQTAQWLQQQQNLAPYLQAGQQGLSQLQQLAGREQPALPGATPGIRSADYNASLPNLMPGWRPQAYQGPDALNAQSYRWNPQQGPQAQDYRWNPQQGPSAAAYRYTPGQTPDANQYQSGPPQLYQGAMPGTQVSQLTGQQVLDQDPGAAFRQSEARKALEGSAAAKGGLLSGSTLGALQRQSQDLASQEYGNAFNRMMQRDVEQYGRDWGQYQQRWNQGVQGTELGLRTQAQNFGQATGAAELRERVNQVAAQQGWSQAQAEAAFREQMAQGASQQGWGQSQAEAAFREQQNQMASQQGWNQALQGQQNQFTQGLETSRYNQDQQKMFTDEIYRRMLAQNQLVYGRDVTQNTTDYDRQQALYRQQLGQHLLPWEQSSTLANLGGQAVGMYGNQGQSAANSIATLLGRQGEAQGLAPAASGLSWQRALTGATNQVPSLLANLNA